MTYAKWQKSALKWAGILALVVLSSLLLGSPPVLANGVNQDTDSTDGLPPVGEKVDWADFTGAPTIPASTVGLWVWSEDVGGQEILHVRSGSDGSAKTFTGTILAPKAGNFYDLSLVNGTGDDSATNPKYNEIDFTLATTGGGEGLDVSWSGRWLYLDLYVNGAYVPGKIFTGAAAKATTGAPIGTHAGLEGLLTLPITLLDGQTTFKKRIADGYYLYRDANGRYHMRLTTTSPQDVVTYRGHISVEEDTYRGAKEFRGDPRDFIRIVGDKEIDFRFVTKGYRDGMDWTLASKNKPDNMVFTLRMNGNVAAPNIALGSNTFGTIKALSFRLVDE